VRPRRAPRELADALRAVRQAGAPETVLAAVQAVWAGAVGPGIAERAEPVAEREGVVTVACESAVWAQELDLLQSELVGRLNAAIEADSDPGSPALVKGIRLTADRSRFYT
jgi:predicted nucleic acid-binding Zn ribbon protein